MNQSQPNQNPKVERTLNAYDVSSIVVGIIIGSGIFVIPATVAGMLGSAKLILLAWLLGGALSFVGALCYAELASTYPKEGGDYFFLNHAYGSWAGFLYAWGRLIVIHTGNIATMAYIAGKYGNQLIPIPYGEQVFALTAVIVFTTINILGIREGKWTQNILTAGQVLGLLGVIAVAFFVEIPNQEPPMPDEVTFATFLMALIFVQFCFGGWSDCAFVASEVKNPGRNIIRSLFWGISIVTLLYLLINASIIHALGIQQMAASDAVMADVFELGLEQTGVRIISVIAIVAALGSLNGMVLTGGRIFHAFGVENPIFKKMGTRSYRFGTPVFALIVQCAISIILISSGHFEDLVVYTASAHWFFMIMIGIAIFVFRKWEPGIERPFRIPLYPVVPILYIASCCMLFYSTITYAGVYAAVGFGAIFTGLPLYYLSEWYQSK